jgi:uncharacterized protein YdcH (DUF465 family)
MKNIEILELEGKIKNPIMEFLLEHNDYLAKEQIDAILTRGETGLEDLHLILKAYNQHFDKLNDSENSLVFIVHVISFLAELKDESSFEDMLAYLKTDSMLADEAWNDSYMEDFPRYWSLFPNKIEQIDKALYDTEITIQAKSVLITGLTAIAENVTDSSLVKSIREIFEKYLEFLHNEEQRETQNVSDWADIEFLIGSTIIGYMDCGGDAQNKNAEYFVKNNLVDNLLSVKELQNWGNSGNEFSDIYEMNEIWEEASNREENYEKAREREQELIKVVNQQKAFKKIFDRNDKVNVKYKADGKVISDVKYKKVEDDLISGKCELI